MSSPELSVAPGRAARLRAIAITPQLFVWLAAASALGLYLILVTGATVRLTASGLGCENWPGCQAGQPFPETGVYRLDARHRGLRHRSSAPARWRGPGPG